MLVAYKFIIVLLIILELPTITCPRLDGVKSNNPTSCAIINTENTDIVIIKTINKEYKSVCDFLLEKMADDEGSHPLRIRRLRESIDFGDSNIHFIIIIII